MVAGGRAKPWRQKGTGRARAGTTRAPQWTGGGVVFGPSPRNYTGKVNRKAHRKALQIALSAHAAGGTLAAVDAATFKEPKTKQAAELVAGWHDRGPLVRRRHLRRGRAARSFRNLERTHVVDVSGLEVADLVWARRLAVSQVGTRGARRERHVNGDPRSVLISPVVSEKSYGLIAERHKYTFKVHPPRPQDAGPPGRRGGLRRRRDRR